MKHKHEEHYEKPEQKKLIAKRDFTIAQNQIRIEIKAGDDVSNIPPQFIENLKTEGII